MKLDLAAAANTKAATGKVRAVWTGGKIEIQETVFVDLVVRAIAARMGANLFAGLRPDGSGPMPGRKRDGLPRGQGSAIAKALTPLRTGALSWFIAAHRENPGHLARIMGDVPLRAPPIEAIRLQVRRALELATRLAEIGGGSDVGGTIDRRSTARTKKRLRAQLASTVRDLGRGKRSRLMGRFRSAGRRAAGR